MQNNEKGQDTWLRKLSTCKPTLLEENPIEEVSNCRDIDADAPTSVPASAALTYRSRRKRQKYFWNNPAAPASSVASFSMAFGINNNYFCL